MTSNRRQIQKVVLALFQNAQERVMENVHAPIFEVMKQAAVKVFFTIGIEEFLYWKMYKLAEFQNSKQDLVRTLLSCKHSQRW